MKTLVLILSLFASLAFAAPQTLTTEGVQTVTGAKTFAGSCKLLLAGSTSGTTCLQAPAIAGSTTAIVFPSTAGTLALSGANVAYTQLTGMGTGVATWLGTPTGANLVSALSSGGGSTNFLRADGSFAEPPGGAPAVGSITGLGTGVATALAVNVGSAGAPVVLGGALGTPSSGVATNLTGTASGLTAGAATLAASATVLATPRAIYGNNFDGSAALTQIVASTYGGTGNGFTKFTGPSSSEKTFTLPNADSTLMVNPMTTGGDVIYGGASGVPTRLANGSAGQVLQSNGTTVAPSWATASGGDLVRIAQVVTVGSATTITFSGISGSYTNLRIVFVGRAVINSNFAGARIQFNGDTTSSNYTTNQYLVGGGGSAGAGTEAASSTGIKIFDVPGVLSAADSVGMAEVLIPSYAATVFQKIVQSHTSDRYGSLETVMYFGVWKSTAAITSIVITTDGTNFANGTTATLYGMN